MFCFSGGMNEAVNEAMKQVSMNEAMNENYCKHKECWFWSVTSTNESDASGLFVDCVRLAHNRFVVYLSMPVQTMRVVSVGDGRKSEPVVATHLFHELLTDTSFSISPFFSGEHSGTVCPCISAKREGTVDGCERL
jgi:hypothetical protein